MIEACDAAASRWSSPSTATSGTSSAAAPAQQALIVPFRVRLTFRDLPFLVRITVTFAFTTWVLLGCIATGVDQVAERPFFFLTFSFLPS